MTRQDVLTVGQIAEILQISQNTIQRKSWRPIADVKAITGIRDTNVLLGFIHIAQ